MGLLIPNKNHEYLASPETLGGKRPQMREEENLARSKRVNRDWKCQLQTKHPKIDQGWSYYKETPSCPQSSTQYSKRKNARKGCMDEQTASFEAPPEKIQRIQEN